MVLSVCIVHDFDYMKRILCENKIIFGVVFLFLSHFLIRFSFAIVTEEKCQSSNSTELLGTRLLNSQCIFCSLLLYIMYYIYLYQRFTHKGSPPGY